MKKIIGALAALFIISCSCPPEPGVCQADDCGVPAGTCDGGAGEYPILCTPDEVVIGLPTCEDSGVDACGMRVWCCTNAAPVDCSTTAELRGACLAAGAPSHWGFPAACAESCVETLEPPGQLCVEKTGACAEISSGGQLVACCPEQP